MFDLESGRELTNQRVPKPMARTNTTIIDFFGTTRFMLGRSGNNLKYVVKHKSAKLL